MSHPVILAQSKIGNDSIVIKLIESHHQATVIISWPQQSISISASRFDDIMAAITRLFSNASMELARAQAGGGKK